MHVAPECFDLPFVKRSSNFRLKSSLNSRSPFFLQHIRQDPTHFLKETSTAMETMTSTFMQNSFSLEANSRLNLVGDIDAISEGSSESLVPAQTTTPDSGRSKQASNPRVQVLRLASIARREQRGAPGTTPPFLPEAPSLLRFDQEEASVRIPGVRKPSPLRNLTLSNYSTSVNSRYDSEP